MKAYIGKSKLHGKGIFASKNIRKGEIIFNIKGKKINFLISDKQRAKIAGFNWIGVGKNSWIDPVGLGLYYNHSCEPNSAIKGRVQVIAIRNIKKDEEITSDYSLTETDIFWHIKCTCGSKNCRKVVNSIQFLPPKTYTKYSNYIPIYFRNIFKKFRESNFNSNKDLESRWVHFIKKNFSI